MGDMKERPILFSGPLVRAIIEGRKTQTRRLVRDPGLTCTTDEQQLREILRRSRCPYGKVGDRLWVRESFRLRLDQDDVPPSQDWWKSGAWYQADDESLGPTGCGGGPGKLRPSIHMPRWASRIDLEVTEVRVERLQEITEEDARAEGVDWAAPIRADEPDEDPLVTGYPSSDASFARDNFQVLWDDLNGKRASWASNPFVWVVSFKVLEVIRG